MRAGVGFILVCRRACAEDDVCSRLSSRLQGKEGLALWDSCSPKQLVRYLGGGTDHRDAMAIVILASPTEALPFLLTIEAILPSTFPEDCLSRALLSIVRWQPLALAAERVWGQVGQSAQVTSMEALEIQQRHAREWCLGGNGCPDRASPKEIENPTSKTCFSAAPFPLTYSGGGCAVTFVSG